MIKMAKIFYNYKFSYKIDKFFVSKDIREVKYDFHIKLNKIHNYFSLNKNRTKKITNIFFSYLIIIYFFNLTLSNIYCYNKISNSSYIELTINKKGNSKVFFKRTYFGNQPKLPDEIYINGIKQDEIKFDYDLNETKNILRLIWEEALNDTSYMFLGVHDAEEIDLSKFDFSKLTNMNNMFSQCDKLTSISFGNIKPPLLRDMGAMFSECRILASLNLSNFDTSLVTDMYRLFDACKELISLDLSNFNTSQVTDMHYMFYGCNKLKFLDISSFNTSLVENMESMFSGCSLLKTLNLSHFDTSKVTSMFLMFAYCSSLVSLDLSNFDTSQVENMESMFFDCNSLGSLYIYNFNTSKVNDMQYMFKDCISLTTLNISNFDTSKVTFMTAMFQNCYSLTSLNLSNFDTSKVERIFDMFLNCSSLKYLDLSNFKTPALLYSMRAFANCTSLISLDLSNFNVINSNLESIFVNSSELEYINLENTLIDRINISDMFEHVPDKILACSHNNFWENILSKCIIYINCTDINGNSYEHKCFQKCSYMNNNDAHKCLICGSNYYLSNSKFNEFNSYINCYQQNNIIESTFEQNQNIEKESTNNLIEEKTYSDIQQQQSNIDNEIYEVPITDEYIFIINDTIITNNIITYLINNDKSELSFSAYKENNEKNISVKLITDNQALKNYKSKIIIDLFECETKLIQKYNIYDNNNSLVILIIEIEEKGMKIPKVEYEVFNKNFTKVNLEICKYSRVIISIPVKINETINQHNASSDYYNNLCSRTTSYYGTDICLSDRRKEFIKYNKTLCEEDCILIDYDFGNERSKCSCLTKIKIPFLKDIKFDKKKLLNNFKDINNIANINFMKCFKTVFKKDFLKYNYGFMIFILGILLYFICDIIFCCKLNNFNKIIKEIVSAKNYISKISKMKNNKANKKAINVYKNKSFKNSNIIFNYIFNKLKHKRYKKNIRKRQSMNFNNSINTNSFLKKSKTFKNCTNLMKKKKKIKNVFLPTYKNNTNKNINFIKYKNILKYNDKEINSLPYQLAILKDKRTYCQYYISLLKTKNYFIFTFFNNNDYNSKAIKIFLFFFSFDVSLTVNALFFSDKTMNKIYEDKGDFDLIYQIPQILYSSLITIALNLISTFLSLTENNIISIKQEKIIKNLNSKAQKKYCAIKAKFTIFCFIIFFVLIIFGYYITCFCCIYSNTQIQLIKDSGISFVLPLIYPFFICLIPGLFRIPSLDDKKKKRRYLYGFSKLIQTFS